MLLAARAAGEFFRRIKQPALVGEILVGIIFGPTIMGRLLPGVEAFLFPRNPAQGAMLETVSWLGVFFLLLVTGFEVDSSVIWRERRSSLFIGILGTLVPMAIGTGAGLIIPAHFGSAVSSPLVLALFTGVVLSISAVPVIAKVLHDFDILKSDFGLVALASSTVKDILGWTLFTIIAGIGTKGIFNWLATFRILGGTILFLVLSFTLGRFLVNRAVGWLNRVPLPKPGIILSFIVLLGAVCGALTQAIGIHAAFGFLVAGIMAGETKGISERTRETVSQLVNAVFVPLFFVSIGLKVDFLSNFDPLLVIVITVLAVTGKFAGAWLGARLSGMSAGDSRAMGVSHTPGGAMEIVIAMLALQFGVIDLAFFEAIVIAAIFSSIIVAPLLYLALGLRRSFNALAFFLEGAVVSELSGDTPREIIGELCSAISAHDGMPGVNESCAAVNLREEIMGTGMEQGIAIPHARMEGLSRPVFTFGRSRKGVDWNTSDGMPVRLAFLLLTPEEDKEDYQVKILASIARILEDEKVRTTILEARDRDEMLERFSAAMRRDRMRQSGRKA